MELSVIETSIDLHAALSLLKTGAFFLKLEIVSYQANRENGGKMEKTNHPLYCLEHRLLNDLSKSLDQFFLHYLRSLCIK